MAWISDATYGRCDASAGGCAEPLDIQSWPECDRNFSSYGGHPAPAALRPRTSFSLSGSHKIPTVWITDSRFGAQLEMYTGQTTIVVFADHPDLARSAAHALARTVAPKLSRVTAAQLRSDAVNARGCDAAS